MAFFSPLSDKEAIKSFLIIAAKAILTKTVIANPAPLKCFISSFINSATAQSISKLPSKVTIPSSKGIILNKTL